MRIELTGLFRNVSLHTVRSGLRSGYRVAMNIRAPFEDSWETVSHFALFALRSEAEAFAQRIQRAPMIDLRYWVWYPSIISPFELLQNKPTAIFETIPLTNEDRATLRLQRVHSFD